MQDFLSHQKAQLLDDQAAFIFRGWRNEMEDGRVCSMRSVVKMGVHPVGVLPFRHAVVQASYIAVLASRLVPNEIFKK
jgi:hypothetical protein